MMTISFRNSGGELDHKDARTCAEAAKAAIAMIEGAGELYSGDMIMIEGEEEEAT